MRYTILALLVGLFQTPAAPRPMRLVDLLDVPSLGDPQRSPNGRQVLYVLTAADWKVNRSLGHIWRASTDGSGPPVQMTNGPRGESAPRWSPDGRLIAFVATRDTDVAQIYLINDAGGEARQLTHHATSPGNITWAPAGDAIYFVADEPKSKEQRDRERQKDDVYAYDENFQQQHLWKVTVADGAEHRITEGDYSVLDYALSRDGSRIALHRAPTPLLGDADQGEVWVLDTAGGHPVQLTHNQVGESNAQLSPDNTRVLFLAGANARFESYYNDNIFLVPAAGGTATPLLPDLAYEVEDAHWSRDGSSIVFQANMGVHSELFQVDVATRTPATSGRWRPPGAMPQRRRSRTSSITWLAISACPARKKSPGRAPMASRSRDCSSIPWITSPGTATHSWYRRTAARLLPTGSGSRGAGGATRRS